VNYLRDRKQFVYIIPICFTLSPQTGIKAVGKVMPGVVSRDEVILRRICSHTFLYFNTDKGSYNNIDKFQQAFTPFYSSEQDSSDAASIDNIIRINFQNQTSIISFSLCSKISSILLMCSFVNF